MSLNFGEFVAVGSMSAAVNMVDDACGSRRATLIASEGGWESLPRSRAKFAGTTRANTGLGCGFVLLGQLPTPEFW